MTSAQKWTTVSHAADISLARARAAYAALACWAVLTCLRASLFLAESVGAAAAVRREAMSAGLVVSRRLASATSISCTCCRTHRTRTKTHRNQRTQRNATHESSGRTSGCSVFLWASLAVATCRSIRLSMLGIRPLTAEPLPAAHPDDM